MATTRNAWGIEIVCVLLAAGAVACASSGFRSGIYTDDETGYSIPDPNLVSAAEGLIWSRESVNGTDLAFRGPDDAFLAISSHCDATELSPAVLGRQLLVGLKDRKLSLREEFEFAGGKAFRQIVDAVDKAGDSVRTNTVTLVRAGCVVDWMLVAKGPMPEVEASFDRWWRAFDPGRMPVVASVPAPAEAAP